ncbi:hypothetical protein BDP81DRAFT_449060 [Colletotrichum phormii]|uniref:Uncharacterized protein n=1 Tax=Colletotrichum phormii TaxID=359342 RepID=A0AAI9ZW78_9PEZI|nr:uncharacterized protein BDP81DRAFT_449060 [Colletotrichum phormii]KAK1637979.1 hypothetical protein BDP81DRAFT_449060 [Colletotrichum phormii]
MTDANTRDPSPQNSAPHLPPAGRHSVPREKPWSERFPSKDFQDYQRQAALRLARAQEAGIQLCDIYFDAAWGLPWWEGMKTVGLRPGEGQKLVRLSGNGESSHGEPSNNDDLASRAAAPESFSGDKFLEQCMYGVSPTNREAYAQLADMIWKEIETGLIWMGGSDYEKLVDSMTDWSNEGEGESTTL